MWWTNSPIEYGICKIARSDTFYLQKKKKINRNDKIISKEEWANSATPGRRDEVVRG